MKRSLCLVAALGAVCAANAETIVVNAALPLKDTNWTDSLVVSQFNVPGATLNSVKVKFHGAVKGSVWLENMNSDARDFSASLAYDLKIAKPNGSALLTINPDSQTFSGRLSAFDGEADYAGTSGFSRPDVQADKSGTVTLTSVDDLAAFTGSGTVSLKVDASAKSTVVATGNFDKLLLNQALADVEITYDYSLPAPKLGSLGDRIWFDADADGKQDDDEHGVANLTVKLLDANGTVLATDVTDAEGYYLFSDLNAGTYKVQFSKPTGYAYTLRDQGSDDNIDSDSDANGQSGLVTLAQGQDRTDVDAGIVGALCLGDRVWKDLDKDGLQDSCEPGVPNVPVHLLDANGNVIADTKTDACGYYKFCNLAPGDYTVDFDAPAGYGFTKQFANANYRQWDSNADPLTGKATVTLASNDMTIDAGLIGAFKLGDTVWLDCDGDGKYEPEVGELGIKNVKVFLIGDTNGDNWPDVYASTTTDADGKYKFLGLMPGNYAVTVNAYDLPRNVVPSYDLDGVGTKHFAIGRITTTDRLDFDFGYKPYTNPCGGSHGWWSCNPYKWSCDKIWVGGKCHSKATICGWFKRNDWGDKSICMYQRLCAAKLNVGDGCNEGVKFTCGKVTCSVKDAIKKCDEWMKNNPVGCKVSGSSYNWSTICDYYGILDKFCNGR